MAPPVVTTPKGYTRGSVQTTNPNAVAQSVTRELGKMERAQPNMRTVQLTEGYDVDPRDRTLLVDTTAGDVIINLRSAKQQLVLPLDIIKTSADGHSVQVIAQSGESIGGPLGALTGLVWAELGVGFSLHPDGLGQWWVEGSAVSWGSIGGLTSSAPDTIKAIADLVHGAPNTFPYYTGLAAAALATLTPYARTILACVDAAAARVAILTPPSDATKFLNGSAAPAFAAVKDSDLSLSDITTNDVSITKHGFIPKLPNDSSKFLNGVGAWVTSGVVLPTYPFTSATGLMFRWNASLSQTDQTAKGYAQKIYDISGNARHSDTATSLAPKWFDAAFLNRFPAIFFDLGHRITVSAMPGLASPLKCTIIVIGSHWTSSGNSHIYNWSGNPIGFGSSTPLDFMYNGTLPAAHTMSGEVGSHKIFGDPWRQPIIAIHSYDGASSVQSLNNNEATVSPGTAATGTTNSFSIGADSATTAGSFSRVLMAEIAVLNFAANATQRQALLTYYKSFYGMVTP